MKLIVGLGNPGEKYEKTRHNVGFVVVDRLVEQLQVKSYGLSQEWEKSKKGKLQYIWFDVKEEKLELVKPLTFMNNSGYSVSYAYKKHSLSPDDLYIIHDDLDLTLGSFKIQKGKGPKEHNGLLSIYEKLGTKNFWHVRVGVDNRLIDKGQRTKGESYVLQNFTPEEKEVLEELSNKLTEELLKKIYE
ncbi:MAG: Peptidyl-tRNA hydrolase [Candidatus Woesebacteria bacterium GW2011_GWA1_37_7]|uniref:Peptidyl-tRNA hydrolase n=1 Tax=Candidatus Woesebacteria bacterium GW2011_GWA1_37_7 TaxID=1618545 RepID=A0A0G0K8N1_9BACT|nr:MAG: Peptidyl-tRNA hydrolase [Candidatus Woesebacteria bacterium GW2011_GWA1_37_7]